MARAFTGELEVSTGLLGTRVSLVASVPAVILSITLPGHWDAATVATAELGILAGHINTAGLVWGKT